MFLLDALFMKKLNYFQTFFSFTKLQKSPKGAFLPNHFYPPLIISYVSFGCFRLWEISLAAWCTILPWKREVSSYVWDLGKSMFCRSIFNLRNVCLSVDEKAKFSFSAHFSFYSYYFLSSTQLNKKEVEEALLPSCFPPPHPSSSSSSFSSYSSLFFSCSSSCKFIPYYSKQINPELFDRSRKIIFLEN